MTASVLTDMNNVRVLVFHSGVRSFVVHGTLNARLTEASYALRLLAYP
jgi:hypothetical protein